MKPRQLRASPCSHVLAGLLIVPCLAVTRADDSVLISSDSVPSSPAPAAVGELDVQANHRLAATELHARSSYDGEAQQHQELKLKAVYAMPSLMRQERMRNGRQDAIEIDGKAQMMKDDDSPELEGPLPAAPPQKPALLDPPQEVSLAYLSRAVYNFTTPVNEWELQAKVERVSYWLRGHTHAALYRKSFYDIRSGNTTSQCALVFATTGNLANWTQHPESKKTLNLKQCKLVDVHKGMMEEWLSLMLSPQYDTSGFESVDGGCDTFYTGGHGLGGSLASIHAACANAAYGNATLPALFRDGVVHTQAQTRQFPNVSGLYTFGAPAVSKIQLLNDVAEDHTFAGGRFYSEDKIHFDPVPFSGTQIGFVHPKVAAIRLEEQLSGWVNRREYEATTVNALREPDYFRTPWSHLSEVNTYLERVLRAPLKTDLTVPGLKAQWTTPPDHKLKGGHHDSSKEAAGYGAELGNTSYADEAFAIASKGNNSLDSPEDGRGSQIKNGVMRNSQRFSLVMVSFMWVALVVIEHI